MRCSVSRTKWLGPVSLALTVALVHAATTCAGASVLEGEHSWRPLGLPGFQAASVVVDPVRDRLITFGGLDARGRKTALVYARSLSTMEPWTQLIVDGPGPSPRMNHSAIYDPLRDRMVVYGGWPEDAVGSREVWALELSGVPRWTNLTPTSLGPGYRIGAQMAYDPEGDRLVVVGGHPSDNVAFPSEVWTLDLSNPAEWINASPPGPWPPPREDGAMIYDQPRRRMVLFGGCPALYGMGAQSDVWELLLGDTLTWREIHPLGEAVPGLHSFAAALDATRGRLLVFSGRDSFWGNAPRAECWALQLADPPSWSRIDTSAPRPSARYFSRAAYDDVRDRMILFGGTSDDVWRLDFAADPERTEVDPASGGAPFGLFGASATYDPTSLCTYLLGGRSGYYVHGTFYPFDSGDLFGATLGAFSMWRSVARSDPPLGRHGHSIILDPPGRRLLLWGGSAALQGDSSLWQLPLEGTSPWSRLEADGPSPAPRYFHTATYDSRRHRVLAFGGMGQSGPLGDLWALSLDGSPAWTRIEADGAPPLPRSGHVAAYDSVSDRMVLFGGEIGSVPVDDTWELLLSGTPRWVPRATLIRPPARTMAAAAFDGLRRRLVIFGGRAGSNAPLADFWTFDLAGAAGWNPAATIGPAPAARWGAAAAFDEARDLLVLIGGTRTTDPQIFDSNTWLMSSTVPVVTTLSGPRVRAHPGRVELEWSFPVGQLEDAVLQRLSAFEDWRTLDAEVSCADGRARSVDLSATPGARYAYRLKWKTVNTVRISDAAWVDVPNLRFALLTTSPNPGAGPISVEFSLPDGAPASLELLDVAGRRLWRDDVGRLGAGDHFVTIDPTSGLRPGIYLIRLERSGESRVARVGIVR